MKKILFSIVCATFLLGCTDKFEKENIQFAEQQIGKEVQEIEASGSFKNPCTINKEGKTSYINVMDWRSGFFPGLLWYLYELTSKDSWLALAEKYTLAIEDAKNCTQHHDVGFMVGCSFGNAYRLTGKEHYKEVLIQGARSLATRFRPGARIIQSWNVSQNDSRGWICPVIIDNMMNLELMYKATQLSGDSSFWKIAVSHADKTLQEHFRPNGSCYHVIDYDPNTGEVLHRNTAQGYSHESVWSRGQAWAIYGFTISYRFTNDERYLKQALKTFRFMKGHKNMEPDGVPYWDMDAPNIPNEPRDVSSAAIIASALYELVEYTEGDMRKECKDFADKIMTSLATPAYRAKVGANGNFLLMHSVGSLPHHSEVDVPLNYADYYFIEAIQRRK